VLAPLLVTEAYGQWGARRCGAVTVRARAHCSHCSVRARARACLDSGGPDGAVQRRPLIGHGRPSAWWLLSSNASRRRACAPTPVSISIGSVGLWTWGGHRHGVFVTAVAPLLLLAAATGMAYPLGALALPMTRALMYAANGGLSSMNSDSRRPPEWRVRRGTRALVHAANGVHVRSIEGGREGGGGSSCMLPTAVTANERSTLPIIRN
jgi:hypothetical protein